MRDDLRQYYLRAEPSVASRRTLRSHQKQLADVCAHLKLSPRFTRPDDLHWTTIFLDSPARWTRALRAVGADVELAADELFALTLPRPSSEVSPFNFGRWETVPTSYDAFSTGVTNAVFVLRLHDSATAPADAVLAHVRTTLKQWEQNRRLPDGTVARLFRHPWFPLFRELKNGTPHITLARGRVSRVRQWDVLRSLRTSALASRDPLPFDHLTLRMVRSPIIVRTFR